MTIMITNSRPVVLLSLKRTPEKWYNQLDPRSFIQTYAHLFRWLNGLVSTPI